jgi:cytochrome c556
MPLTLFRRPAFLATLACAALLAACGGEAPDTHPNQPVTKRRAVFKDMVRALEPLGQMARERQGYDAPYFDQQARELQRLSQLPWAYFTPDSNYPPTHAKPEVWQKADAFKQATEDYMGKVNHLVEVGGGGDLAAIKRAVADVQGSCKSCHDQFRQAMPSD